MPDLFKNSVRRVGDWGKRFAYCAAAFLCLEVSSRVIYSLAVNSINDKATISAIVALGSVVVGAAVLKLLFRDGLISFRPPLGPTTLAFGWGIIAIGVVSLIVLVSGYYRPVQSSLSGYATHGAIFDFLNSVREELFYRYLLLMTVLVLTSSLRVAILMQAAIFALLHPNANFAIVFATGVFIAAMAVSFRSIWVAVLLHFGLNIGLSLAFGHGVLGNAAFLDPTSSESLIVKDYGMILVIVCSIVLSLKILDLEKPSEKGFGLPHLRWRWPYPRRRPS